MNALGRTRVLGGIIGLALILSACGGGGPIAANETRESQSFSVSGEVTVTVSTYNGTIDVRAGGDDQVRVEVTKRGGGDTDAEAKADLNNIQLALSQSAGSVKLVATHSGTAPENSAVSFVVTVPPASTLEASVDNGSIKVDGVKGDVTLTAGNGDLTVRGVDEGVISAKTTNGNVTLEGREVASVTATSSNGSVSFAGSLAESDAANRLDAGNGSASLTLPADAQFAIDATTANGALTSGFDFQGDLRPRSVEGTIGASPAFSVVIRVQNGNITISKQ